MKKEIIKAMNRASGRQIRLIFIFFVSIGLIPKGLLQEVATTGGQIPGGVANRDSL